MGALALALGVAAGAARAQPPEPTSPAPTADAPAAEAPAPKAPEPAPYNPVIVRSKVVRKPTDAELSGLYPAEAIKHAKMGKAVITCEVGLNSRLEKCVVTSEDPPGYGFGEALIKAAAFYRVQPPSVDGTPAPHAKFQLTMPFRLSLDSAAEQLAEREARDARATAAPEETRAQRQARLGPLTRAGGVLWAPVAFAGFVLAGLLSANFSPLPEMRRRRRGQRA